MKTLRRTWLEPQSQGTHDLARRVHLARQTELRAAEHGIDAGKRLTIEHVRRVDAPIEREPGRQLERPRDTEVEAELRGSADGVSRRVAKLPRRGRRVRRRIQIETGRRRGRGAGETRAQRSDDASAGDRGEEDWRERQAAARRQV